MKRFILIAIILFSFQMVFPNFKISFNLKKIIIENQLEKELLPQEEDGFEDNWIGISWTLIPSGSKFILENNSKSTLSLIWDECLFVGIDKVASKVIHSGVRLLDKEKSILPSIIPSEARIEDCITASDKVTFSEIVGWIYSDEWPDIVKDKEFAKMDISKWELRIILVIKKGEEKRIYNFYFTPTAKAI